MTTDGLLDLDQGWVNRAIYSDEELYQAELDKIFGHCWLFLAHESQLPKAGSFVTTSMGEDGVIVTRRRDGSLGAYLNSCPHRGNRVCHADAGTTRGFTCNYHGWSFGLDGSLLGVHEPGAYERSVHFDKSRLGLTPVAQVASYRGLVFGTFDPDGPTLEEYLGEFTWYLDIILDNDPDGTEFLPGATKSMMHCNWKVPSENFAGDALHAGWTHDSGARAMLGGPVAVKDDPSQSFQANIGGHCWESNTDGIGNAAALGEPEVLRYLKEHRATAIERLGEPRATLVASAGSATVFPNFSFLPGQNTFRVWHPRGPHRIALQVWTLVNRSAPEKVKAAYRRGTMMTFSPAGLFEMDDGDNWEYVTHGSRGPAARQQMLFYGLGIDSQIESDLPGRVYAGQYNDANQRAFLREWAERVGVPCGTEAGAAR